MSLSGTVAYLQDTDQAVNVMTLGKVDIEQHEYERVLDEKGSPVEGVEGTDFKADYQINRSYKLQEFTQAKPAYPAVYSDGKMAWDEFQQLWNQVGAPGSNDLFNPGMKNVIDKFVFVENTGKSDAYYRTIVAVEMPEGLTEGVIHFNFNVNNRFDYNNDKDGVQDAFNSNAFYTTIQGIRYIVYTATYTDILKPGEVSRPSLLQLYLDPKTTNEDCALFGDTWDVLVVSQGVQAMGFDDAHTALNTAFGKVSAASHPWMDMDGKTDEEGDQDPDGVAIPGVTDSLAKAIKTAPDGTDITKSVEKVIFGKTAEYAEIVSGGYPSTIVGNGVTAYYVLKDGKYTVYMLSNGVTYAPKDSTGLFRDMTALKEVDLSNLDMSRVESAKYMFRECTSLTSIGDVSKWDVSNVTSARGMFYNCKKLDGLDVSDWDVSSIEDAGWMFYNNASVSELDVSKWDTSSMNFAKSMFYGNEKLTELAVEDWDMSEVTDASYMFSFCKKLGDIDFSKWDVSKVQKFNNMFKHAQAMTTLDLSSWDTSSADDMNHMFANCGKLKYLDISGFDTSNVTTMAWMFYEIEAEKIYVGDKWSLDSIANLDEGVYSHKIATAPLVGGQGTTCRQIMDLDSKCVAENGARFNGTARYMIADGGSAKPGLLTYKN